MSWRLIQKLHGCYAAAAVVLRGGQLKLKKEKIKRRKEGGGRTRSGR
jgi:hypothetical protein